MPNEITQILITKIRSALEEADSLNPLDHTGTKGRMREALISRILTSLVPPTWSVETGIVCSSDGDALNTQSGQEDIIIYDRSILPPIFEEAEQRIIPIESVLAIVEVKSQVAAEDIEQAISHSLALKNLNNTWGTNGLKGFKKGFEYPTYNIFGLSSTLTGKDKTEWERIIEKHSSLSVNKPVINSICVKGGYSHAHNFLYPNEFNDFFESNPADSHPDDVALSVLQWLTYIIDQAKRIHSVRSKEMAAPTFIAYLNP